MQRYSSGPRGGTRNAIGRFPVRGFESHPLRCFRGLIYNPDILYPYMRSIGIKKISVLTVVILFFIVISFGIFREYRISKVYFFNSSFFPEPDASCNFSLPKGDYIVNISYEAKQDSSVSLKADNDQMLSIALPASQQYVSYPFTLTHPTDRAKITGLMSDEFSINEISLTAGKHLFTDYIFHLLLLFAGAAILILLYKKRNAIDIKTLVFLSVVCIVINLPLYIYRGSNWGVDTRAHMLRIEGIMTGLLDRQLPVIISPNYLNEFGELSFLYPDFFLYPSGILRIMSVSMFTVYRFLMVLINILTVLSAYFSAKTICGKKLPVYFSVILYTFEAHRLRIMFMNGAGAGAGIAQIFIPLCIAGLYLILNTDVESGKRLKGVFLLAFGVSGVMESHIMSLLLLFVFLIALILPFIKNLFSDKCRGLKLISCAALLALFMNAGFLIIFISYYFSDWSSSALFWSDFISWCLTPKDIISSPQSHFYIVMLLLTISLLIIFRKNRTFNYRFALVMTVITAVFYFMSTSLFPWKILMDNSKIVYTLAMFIQQAHRFFSLIEAPAVLAPCILLSDNMKSWNEAGPSIKKLGYIALPVLSLMLLTGIFSEMKMFFSNDPLLRDRVSGDYNTELLFDYVPEGTDEESIKYDTGKLSDETDVQSLSYEKLGTHINYTYISNASGVYADLPLLYYKGYRAEDENGEITEIKKGPDGHILADLKSDGNEHLLHIGFRVRPVFTILWIVSLFFTFGACLIYLLKIR